MTSTTFLLFPMTLDNSSKNPGQSLGQSACAILGTIVAARSLIIWSSETSKCNIAWRICCFWSWGRKSSCSFGVYCSLERDHPRKTYRFSDVKATYQGSVDVRPLQQGPRSRDIEGSLQFVECGLGWYLRQQRSIQEDILRVNRTLSTGGYVVHFWRRKKVVLHLLCVYSDQTIKCSQAPQETAAEPPSSKSCASSNSNLLPMMIFPNRGVN